MPSPLESTSPCLVAITGGPGAGKTTLIAELAARGLAIAPEAGRAIILDQRAIDGPALPDRDPALFAELMLAHDMASHRRAVTRGGTTVLDRGVVDTLGYLTLVGIDIPAHMHAACRRFRYDHVFIAPPWREIYATDYERRQDFAEAVATFESVGAAWRAHGYDPIPLPKASTTKRADFVLEAIAHR